MTSLPCDLTLAGLMQATLVEEKHLWPALQADKLCTECMAQKILEMPEDSDEEEDDGSDAPLDDSSEGKGMPSATLQAQHTAAQAANQAQATRRPFLQEGEAAAGPLCTMA